MTLAALFADAVSLAYGESEMSFEMFEENVCIFATLCLCEDTTCCLTDNFIYSFTGRRNYYLLRVACCYVDRVLEKEANGFGDAGGI